MKQLFILLLFTPLCLFSQTIDDFSDGNFDSNPVWFGTTEIFMVNGEKQLQLNAQEAGSAYLCTAINTYSAMEWRFDLRLTFSPSGSNFCNIFLLSNTGNPDEAAFAYYLHIGETGSNDAIELRRIDSTGTQTLCRGTDANVASQFSAQIKVTRDTTGLWSLLTDFNASGVFTLEAQCTDNSSFGNGFFGFAPTFTASNATRFYFDNVYVGQPYIDTTAPVLLNHTVTDKYHIALQFNEALNETSAQALNFAATPDLANPDSVVLHDALISLYFSEGFANGQTYTLQISNISDLANNNSPTFEIQFYFLETAYNDIVINEIMADPDPQVALPNYEYIELYNNNTLGIDIENWTLKIGNSTKTLPAYTLAPHSYLILCHTNAVEALSGYGNCLGLSSFSLTNDGAKLVLTDAQQNLISEVNYNTTWYHDADKSQGGWSLELINPNDLCNNGAANWTASTHPDGGTPASRNSVFDDALLQPEVLSVVILNSNSLQLNFNQRMDSVLLTQAYHYTLAPENSLPALVSAGNNFVIINFADDFEQGNTYQLTVEGLNNCAGIAMEPFQYDFMLPHSLSENCILINEIMFNPISPGVDYVELYNPTEHTYDLKNMLLGLTTQSYPDPPVTVLKPISSESRYLAPLSFILLSTNGNIVAEQYQTNTDNFLDMSSLPNFSTSGGTAILTDCDTMLIDQMNFSEKMHYPLLKITKGVSLERISAEAASTDINNWHSAAENVNYGTPGYQNSMAQQSHYQENEIVISPELFSPDGDGYNDVTNISFKFDMPAYNMSITIFNSEGKIVKHLIESELVDSKGTTAWDGTDDNENRVPLGIYVIYTEAFNLENGLIQKMKKAVVVASK